MAGETQHTAGPWEDAGTGNVIRTKHSGGVLIAQFWTKPSPADLALMIAAPELLDALKALLPEVHAEIKQRQTSGNDEYWQGLKALSDAGHAAIAKAGAA